MSLDKILSVSGKPGLYRMLTQTRTGLVAESLTDGKRVSVGMRHNVSLLSEISVFTLQEEVPLREVFRKIQEKENGAATTVDPKSSREVLEEYFIDVLPDYDEDRVYPSHIAKILKWYNLLLEKGVTDFTVAAATDSQEAPSEAAPASAAEEPSSTAQEEDKKPGKSTTTRKPKAIAAVQETDGEPDETPSALSEPSPSTRSNASTKSGKKAAHEGSQEAREANPKPAKSAKAKKGES